jgi:hypothetical protein
MCFHIFFIFLFSFFSILTIPIPHSSHDEWRDEETKKEEVEGTKVGALIHAPLSSSFHSIAQLSDVPLLYVCINYDNIYKFIFVEKKTHHFFIIFSIVLKRVCICRRL